MFCLRVDIDSRYGLKNGVPNILDALRASDITASFYIPMAGESSVLDLIKYRGGARGAMGGVRLPKTEVLRMALFPKNFAAEGSGWLKDNVLAQGHELGCHAWKHRAWTRALSEINAGEHVANATRDYKTLFGAAPASFAAPAFNTNQAALEAIDANGYLAAGDLPGNKPFHPRLDGKTYRHVQVPVNLKAATTDPLIESYCATGLGDDAVVKRICDDIDAAEMKHDYAVMYCHDFFEGSVKPAILAAVLSHVKKQGYETKTVAQIAKSTKPAETLPVEFPEATK